MRLTCCEIVGSIVQIFIRSSNCIFLQRESQMAALILENPLIS